MSNIDQNVRFSLSAGDNNPKGIYLDYKPGRFLTPDIGPPASNLGQTFDQYVDTASSIEYIKDAQGVWQPVINWSSISHEEPLIQNTIEVDTIEGNSTNDIQINLLTAGTLSIGPTGDLAAVQIQSNGVITSDSASGFSSLSLGNGMGNQVVLDPATLSIIGSPDMNLTASNNVAITANGGTLSALCATTMDVSAPSGLTVFTTGSSGTFFTEGAGTILNILPGTIQNQGLGDLSITSDNNLNVTSTGTLTLTSGAGNQIILAPGGGAVVEITPGANFVTTNIFSSDVSGFNITTTAGPISESSATSIALTGASSASLTASGSNVTIESTTADINLIAGGTITSGAPFYSGAGSSGVPTYSFSGDSNSGIYSLAADTLGFSAGGSGRVLVSTTVLGPVSNNAMDLATAGAAFKDSFFVNAPTITSDARLKTDIAPLPFGLDFIKKLQPVSYRLVQDAGNDVKKVGMLAQDVEAAIHQVGQNSDGFGIVSKGDIYGLKYEAFIPCLIKAVQELCAEVKSLRERVQLAE